MSLKLAVSLASVKIQIGFTFLVPAHLGSPGKGPLNVCVLVNLLFSISFATGYIHSGEIKIFTSRYRFSTSLRGTPMHTVYTPVKYLHPVQFPPHAHRLLLAHCQS